MTDGCAYKALSFPTAYVFRWRLDLFFIAFFNIVALGNHASLWIFFFRKVIAAVHEVFLLNEDCILECTACVGWNLPRVERARLAPRWAPHFEDIDHIGKPVELDKGRLITAEKPWANTCDGTESPLTARLMCSPMA